MLLTVAANPSELCLGESSQLTAIATGGNESYTYSWTSNSGGFTSDVANPIINPMKTTEYQMESLMKNLLQ